VWTKTRQRSRNMCLLRCGVCVHELEDVHDGIIVWLDRAAA
jgi:hypothetical protein